MDTEQTRPSTSQCQPAREEPDDQSDKDSQKSNTNSDIDKQEEESCVRLGSPTHSSENSAVDGLDLEKASDAHAKETKSDQRHHQVRRGRIDKRTRVRHATAPMRRSQRVLEKNERTSKRGSEEVINKENQPVEPRSSETSRTPSEISGEMRVKVERAKSDGRAKRPRRRKPIKRRRRGGRIEKRTRQRQSRTRTRRANRVTKSERARNKRDGSDDTAISSVGSLALHGCARCGHRCCGGRYKYEARMWIMKRRPRAGRIDVEDVLMSSRRVQVGSRCAMLSPLCVNTAVPEPRNQAEHLIACEITPEMIHAVLRRLTMWRMAVTTKDILKDIKRNYPVGSDVGLKEELEEKLRIAAIVGMVEQRNGCWLLGCSLFEQKLTKSHVTWFWKLYRDTMTPLSKKPAEVPAQKKVKPRNQ